MVYIGEGRGVGVPWIVFVLENVLFRQNNRNSSYINEDRRRGHGESCYFFQIVFFFKVIAKKQNEQIVVDRTIFKGQKLYTLIEIRGCITRTFNLQYTCSSHIFTERMMHTDSAMFVCCDFTRGAPKPKVVWRLFTKVRMHRRLR